MPPSKPTVLPRWARTAAGAGGANVTNPTSGQKDTGWTNGQVGVSSYENWLKQNAYDWLAQLAMGLPTGVAEGFSAVPPADPAEAWSAPSVRYGSDLAYVADVVAPILGGTSANRPGSQAANQNSSLGFDAYFFAPARLTFAFNVVCNTTDKLDFYVDGVLTASIRPSTGTGPLNGRFLTDILDPGKHTFDWRFVRGAAASAGSEAAKIDLVQVLYERSERGNQGSAATGRFLAFDDFFYSPNGAVANPFFGGTHYWDKVAAGNGGTLTAASNPTIQDGGSDISVGSAAVAAGDSAALSVVQAGGAAYPNSGLNYLLEGLVLPIAGANKVTEFGWWDRTLNNRFCFQLSGAAPNWKLLSVVGGVQQALIDTGIAFTAGATARLGIMFGGLAGGYYGASFTIDGKATGAEMAIRSALLPGAGVTMSPYARAASVGAAAAAQIDVGWMRVQGIPWANP